MLELVSNEAAPRMLSETVPAADMVALAVRLEAANLLAVPVVEVEIEPDIEADPSLLTIASALVTEIVAVIDASPVFLAFAVTETEIEPEIDVAALFLVDPAAETATDAEMLAAPETVVVLTTGTEEKGADENGAAEKLIYSPLLVKMLPIA